MKTIDDLLNELELAVHNADFAKRDRLREEIKERCGVIGKPIKIKEDDWSN